MPGSCVAPRTFSSGIVSRLLRAQSLSSPLISTSSSWAETLTVAGIPCRPCASDDGDRLFDESRGSLIGRCSFDGGPDEEIQQVRLDQQTRRLPLRRATNR